MNHSFKKQMKKIQLIAISLASGTLALVSCTPTQQQYGLGGAAAGAAVGAIAGDDSRDIVRGILVGGIGGAGYATYKDYQKNQNGTYNTGGDGNFQVPTPSAAPQYPVASHSGIPGVVNSPYKPFNKVRITGFKPGQLAKDPTTDQIFVVPQ